MRIIEIEEHTLIDLLLGDIKSHDKIDADESITRVKLKSSSFHSLQRRQSGLQEWLTGQKLAGMEVKDVKEWLEHSANNGMLVECLETIVKSIPKRWLGRDL